MSEDPATTAFEHLRSEVALLRRAIEGLSAQQPEPAPDYTPSLAKLDKAVSGLSERLGQMAESPALSLTPEIVGEQLRIHATNARTDARIELNQATSGLLDATRVLRSCDGLIRTGQKQRRWVIYAALGGGAAALIAWTGLSGPIARALPASWQVPERVAAAALGQDRWAAGARLMRRADEPAWRRLQLGDDLVLRNSDVIDACWKRAERLKRSVVCEVRVGG